MLLRLEPKSVKNTIRPTWLSKRPHVVLSLVSRLLQDLFKKKFLYHVDRSILKISMRSKIKKTIQILRKNIVSIPGINEKISTVRILATNFHNSIFTFTYTHTHTHTHKMLLAPFRQQSLFFTATTHQH